MKSLAERYNLCKGRACHGHGNLHVDNVLFRVISAHLLDLFNCGGTIDKLEKLCRDNAAVEHVDIRQTTSLTFFSFAEMVQYADQDATMTWMGAFAPPPASASGAADGGYTSVPFSSADNSRTAVLHFLEKPEHANASLRVLAIVKTVTVVNLR